MKKIGVITLAAICSAMFACNSGESNKTTEPATSATEAGGEQIPNVGGANPSYDPNRGAGKFTDVQVGDKLDADMATKGEKIAETKCLSCHKLTDERLVGPGWKGTTTRHTPEWLMNFITNPDEMIDKDPKVQAMLEICMVRMPNQNLSDEEARQLLEFMRKNDGVQ